MIKCVVFDLDDTLYDYSSLNRAACGLVHGAISKKYGVSPEDAKKAFEWGRKKTKEGMPDCAAVHNRLLYIQKMLERLGRNPVEDALEFYDVYWNCFLENMKLRSGVPELLKELRRRSVKTGICTDLTAHIQHRKIRALGLVPYVDFLVTSEEAGYEKPHKRVFELCIEKSGAEPEDILFIGDSAKKDIEGAKACGMNALWFDAENRTSFDGFAAEVEKCLCA